MWRPSLEQSGGLNHVWEDWVTCILSCENIPTEWLCFSSSGGPRGFTRPGQVFTFISWLKIPQTIWTVQILNPYLHVVQPEVLISHGKPFSSHSGPQADGNPAWHIPGLAAGIPLASSFHREGYGQPFHSHSWALGSQLPEWVRVLHPTQNITVPISRWWGLGEHSFLLLFCFISGT